MPDQVANHFVCSNSTAFSVDTEIKVREGGAIRGQMAGQRRYHNHCLVAALPIINRPASGT
jgi:hypothetical protein